jgi:hypothetical protein
MHRSIVLVEMKSYWEVPSFVDFGKKITPEITILPNIRSFDGKCNQVLWQ